MQVFLDPLAILLESLWNVLDIMQPGSFEHKPTCNIPCRMSCLNLRNPKLQETKINQRDGCLGHITLSLMKWMGPKP